jgi:hypothetical protein
MKQKTKDNLIYLGVGLTIAAGFTTYMFYIERTTGKIQEIPGPILWGILSTPGIVALIFERFWEHRRRRSLWVISIVTASINVSAMFVAHRFRWNPPVIVWSVMTVLWVTVALIVAQKFVARDVTPNRRQ